MPASILDNYRGNKNIPGIYQWIINRIPVHDEYYELFAGSAAIASRLPRAAVTVLNDCNPGVCAALKKQVPVDTIIMNCNALQLISSVVPGRRNIFAYCDPPYKLSTRGTTRTIYEHEMTDSDHNDFLSVVRTVKFNCMISHYACEEYDTALKGWCKEERKVRYHGRSVKECIYYNYPRPVKLQSYQFVGSDCWDRQRVTRKINRLVNKLSNLPPLERNAIISRVLDHSQT